MVSATIIAKGPAELAGTENRPGSRESTGVSARDNERREIRRLAEED